MNEKQDIVVCPIFAETWNTYTHVKVVIHNISDEARFVFDASNALQSRACAFAN